MKKAFPLLILLAVAALVTAATASTVNVSAQANIFGSGNSLDSHPDPGGDWCSGPPLGPCGGVAPIDIALGGATAIHLSATGLTNPYTISGPGTIGPDGDAGTGTHINAYTSNFISGVNLPYSMFLAGVFWGPTLNSTPAAWDGSSAPILGQVFRVGSNGTFSAPTGATDLYLGFADAYGFSGNPGYYSDNFGSLDVTYELRGDGQVPEPTSLALMGTGLLSALSRRRKRAK